MMDELIFFDFCIVLYYAFMKLLKQRSIKLATKPIAELSYAMGFAFLFVAR
jgi:hypothetical protein